VLLLSLIGNAFNILNANPFFKDLTAGLIIVAAVALSAAGDAEPSLRGANGRIQEIVGPRTWPLDSLATLAMTASHVRSDASSNNALRP
jgi:hypothetical protein